MRWFFLLLMLVTISAAQDKLILSNGPLPKKQEKPKQVNCAIQELYAISWTMHDPAERHKAMLEWLDKSKCSPEDYVIIWNALSEWAGTSDSPMLRAKIMEKAK